jgi:hypothetical protein
MRWFFALIAAWMLALCLGVAHAAEVPNLSDKRFALVIGNSNYQHVKPLEKAVNDARAIGKALEQAQFRTKVVVNASRMQMNMAINQFVDDIAGGGIGIFFFADHRQQTTRLRLGQAAGCRCHSDKPSRSPGHHHAAQNQAACSV